MFHAAGVSYCCVVSTINHLPAARIKASPAAVAGVPSLRNEQVALLFYVDVFEYGGDDVTAAMIVVERSKHDKLPIAWCDIDEMRQYRSDNTDKSFIISS